MHHKLLATTLLAASLLAAPAIAYAQSDTSPKGQTASTEAKAPMKHHKMHHAHMKPGTTTGMSTRPGATKPTTRKPPAS